jgi:hypothetical protein
MKERATFRYLVGRWNRGAGSVPRTPRWFWIMSRVAGAFLLTAVYLVIAGVVGARWVDEDRCRQLHGQGVSEALICNVRSGVSHLISVVSMGTGRSLSTIP